MVKKAKLDLLEEKVAEEAVVGVPSEQEPPAGRGSPRISGKIVALMFGVGLFLVAVVFSGWMYLRGKTARTAPAALPQQAAVPVAASAAEKEVAASFPGFVIHFKDGWGNDRTLLCGIALALDSTPAEAKRIERRIDVRAIVYTAARNRGGGLLASRDERKRFRREITDRVAGLLGAGRVKSVYFTEFVIL